MARNRYRPGRTVAAFFLGLALAFALVAINGTWSPKLGLDLQGGTRITLIATGSPTAANLEEARGIIDQRVNGSGVSEAEVTRQGNRFVVVEIPGKTNQSLVDTVKRQAQMRFRLVACSASDGKCGSPATSPTSPTGLPTTQPSAAPSSGDKKSGKNRAPLAWAEKTKKQKKTQPSSSPSPSDTASATPLASASPSPTTTAGSQDVASVTAALAWMRNPDAAAKKAFESFTCTKHTVSQNITPDGRVVEGDAPGLPLLACEGSQKYLLTPAVIEGTQLKSASAGVPQQQVAWVVNLAFKSDGTKAFTQVSRALYNTGEQFAIVLDGKVISAPQMNGVITNGQAEISGNFTEASAQSLATSLKFGALPITFEKDPSVETVGPSLAGNQLNGGITAGIIGLVLVMLYCLFYYRGLGLVVVSSLIVAGLATYALVLLLSEGAGFTLTLPGIAGLIVAVGITADSFIVYFERIRDEMRDGRSMKSAVEAGWKRARATCVAADTVSLLAAVVLYIFAAGVVKGFAFALGLSTLIDLAVFFWFTHPMVSWLARFTLFNSGHKLSGLDREALGVTGRPTPTTVEVSR
jgi:preprotein translocase subunit SecD